jgi:hypothetical protein
LLNKRGYISLVIHKKLNEKLISKAWKAKSFEFNKCFQTISMVYIEAIKLFEILNYLSLTKVQTTCDIPDLKS